jgi:hypothetical protein
LPFFFCVTKNLSTNGRSDYGRASLEEGGAESINKEHSEDGAIEEWKTVVGFNKPVVMHNPA